MTEPASPALGVLKFLNRQPLHSLVTSNDHLTDAFTILDSLWLIAQVGNDDTDLATIVSIDGARRVEHSETALERQTAAWANLALIALWQSDVDARVQHRSLQGLQGDRLVEPSTQVHAGALLGAIGGQRMRPPIHYLDFDIFHLFCY